MGGCKGRRGVGMGGGGDGHVDTLNGEQRILEMGSEKKGDYETLIGDNGVKEGRQKRPRDRFRPKGYRRQKPMATKDWKGEWEGREEGS